MNLKTAHEAQRPPKAATVWPKTNKVRMCADSDEFDVVKLG